MSSFPLFSLPVPLVLLLHLYILEYPQANNAEYDHDVFNPRKRGLRERAQTMEDVAYFLVGKVEGKAVKSILPTYPCSQPSESLAFRTSLSKYLEGLRHQCIYPSSSHNRTPAKPTPGLKASGTSVAWWWKDVVVRKSLLEECSGEKFERLMLSLSTHALMKNSLSISPDKMSTLLREQPVIYTASLARYQAARHTWTKAASSLLSSERDLRLVKQSLNVVSTTKYASATTERLKSLVDAKLQSLLQSYWKGEVGRAALLYFVELAGLRLASANSSDSLSASNVAPPDPSSAPSTIPSPLPVAAAHHPTHLKKLRRSVFHHAKAKFSDLSGQAAQMLPVKSHAEIVLAPLIDAEKRVHQALADALARTRKVGEELLMKVDERRRRVSSSAPSSAPIPALSGFWTPSRRINVDFDPKPTRELMLSLGLGSEFDSLNLDSRGTGAENGSEEDVLEGKIRDIREALPPYPSLPDTSSRPRHPSETTRKDMAGTKPKAKNAGKPLVQISRAAPLAVPRYNHDATKRSEPASATGLQVPPIFPPATPAMSPSKSAEMRSIRRKSVRFSIAKRRSGRPSMFGVFNDALEDEVDRLIDETHDFPTDDEDTDTEFDNDLDFSDGNAASAGAHLRDSPFKTPKSSKRLKPRTPINRIWTAGTPKSSRMFQQKMRQSSSSLGRLVDSELDVALPSSASAETHVGAVGGGDDDDWDDGADKDAGGFGDVDATPKPQRRSLPPSSWKSSTGQEEEEEEEEEAFEDDQPSMTLKDILLTADTSHFDLLELSSEDVGIEDGMLVDDASFVWE